MRRLVVCLLLPPMAAVVLFGLARQFTPVDATVELSGAVQPESAALPVESRFLPAKPSVPEPPDVPDFATHVQPLLAEACCHCHSEIDPTSLVNAPEQWKDAAGESLIVPGNAADSRLIRVLTTGNRRAEHRLPDTRTLILSRWIDAGAPVPQVAPRRATEWPVSDQEHWAFRPLQNPEIPTARPDEGNQNPVDAFIEARLEQEGLRFSPRAKNAVLIRRLSFTLTGLPPSDELTETCRQNNAQDFHGKQWSGLVDRLLNSPAYGEHMARHWLDVARYADTNGYEDDGPKPFAWKYRDFVIRAMNRDLRFDDFLQKQIAGDLTSNPAADDYIASGFLRLGAWDSEPEDELRAHFDQVDDMVCTVGLAFMGLTIGCARCHDHPLEPISSVDYTRMTAAFHGLHRPVNGRLESAVPSATTAQMREAANLRRQQRNLQRQALQADDEATAAGLRHRAAALESMLKFERAYRFQETAVSLREARLQFRGNPRSPGEPVRAGPPSILCRNAGVFRDKSVHLPRKQLAEWMVADGRSLTARVIVNRVWQWHFGRGLCPTANNLGISGEAPSHPELLDWLAGWFVSDADWSLKELHRLILTSHTYQRESKPDGTSTQCQLFASFAARRLTAEMLHDAILDVSGLLARDMYGPPEAVGHLREETSLETRRRRRSVYLIVKRNTPDLFLQTFGRPSASDSCAQRVSTDTSTQALTLWNGRLTRSCAVALADRVTAEFPQQPKQQAERAFVLVTGRAPRPEERTLLLSFLKQTGSRAALQQLCLVLLNLDEFVVLR